MNKKLSNYYQTLKSFPFINSHKTNTRTITMSFISATSNLGICVFLLGLVPFKYCKILKKFIPFRYWTKSIIKLTVLMTLLYYISSETQLIGKHTIHLVSEAPVDLIFSAIRLFCMAIMFTYDVVQLFEKNLRKEMYCEVMNEIVDLTELLIFKNLTIKQVCEKLRKREMKIITMIILYGSCMSYFGATIVGASNSRTSFLNFVYFNSHVLMIVVNCVYLVQIFDTIKKFLEYLINRVNFSSETINKEEFVRIHKRVGKIIQKLIKVHGMELIVSFMAAEVFISTSVYMAYALQTDLTRFSSFGFFMILVNSPLLVIFYFTWKLVEVQDMVRKMILYFTMPIFLVHFIIKL